MFKKTLAAISLFYILVNFTNVFGQARFPGWNIFTSMRDVRGVGSHDNIVWAASTGGLFGFNLASPSSSIVKYTTLSGLLSNELTSLVVDNSGNVWSGAIDGSISVYYPLGNSWRVISDILTSTETSKNINNIFQYGGFMFISTEFCIIKFNIGLFQFVDQPYIYLGPLLAVKTPVYQTIVVNDTIWAATKNGIAYANINNYLPIQSSWNNFTVNNSVLRRNLTNTVGYFNNRVYFGTDSGMVSYDGTNLVPYAPLVNGTPYLGAVGKIVVANGNMYFSSYRNGNNVYRVNQSNLNQAQLVYSGDEIKALNIASSGDIVIGTSNKGVNVFKNNTSNYVLPNGPISNIFTTVAVDINGNVWGASGGSNEGIYVYNSSAWKNYTSETYPQLGSNDFRHLYASRNSSVVWAGGYGNGLVRIDGDSLFAFNNQNSCLQALTGNFVLVEGIDEDINGNLWVLNRAAPNPIVKFLPLPCQQYPVPANQQATTVIYLDIDNYNTKWITFPSDVGNERGIVYFNEAITPTGNIIRAPQLGSDIDAVNHLVVDKNSEVWVATNNGVAVIRDPYQVIANPGSIPSIEKMRIIENGISTPLTENVQAIGVDPLNNKWLGTYSNGLLYVSSDGSTLLERYTMSNSPLPDNRILSIMVDPKTGLAYFGTSKGLVSYQTIAVEPLAGCDEIKVRPSPFIIPADKSLLIDGLVAESSIKILTISGTLVAEFDAPGGRVAVWDGKDLNGSYVSSGIYIVAGYNKDASEVCTGKIAVIRR